MNDYEQLSAGFTEQEFAAMLERGRDDPRTLANAATNLLWLARAAMDRQHLMLRGLLEQLGLTPGSEEAKAVLAVLLHAYAESQSMERWFRRFEDVARHHNPKYQSLTAPAELAH